MVDVDALLDELDDIASTLDEVDDLYQRRVEIFALLRQVDPPITVRTLAERAHLTKGAATQVVRTAKERGLL